MISKRVMALILTAVLTSSCVQNPVKAEALSVDNLYANAYKATVTAVEGKNQKLINEARSAIKMLPQNLDWAIGEFSKQVDKVQHPIFSKAYNAVVLAEKNPTQANINVAKDAIDPDMPIYYRGSYSSKLDKIQQEKMKQALDAYNKALKSQLKEDMDLANKLFDDIRTSKNLAIAEWVELVQAKGDVKDLNNGKVNVNNYALLSNSGVYGSTNESKPTTIKGNLLVSNSDGKALTLQNINIEGNIIINFGSGDVILKNVNVNGVTVNNIGSKSLHVTGKSLIKNISIKDTNNDARVVIEDSASIQNTNVLSGAKLEVLGSSTNSNAFGNVVIAPTDTNDIVLEGKFENVSVDKSADVEVTKGSKVSAITLKSDAVIKGSGDIAKLNIETSVAVDIQAKSVQTLEIGKKAEGAKVNISDSTKVNTLNVNSSVNVTGKGTIENANIGANGTTIETKPGNVSVTEGVKVEVGGEVKDDSNSNVIDKVPEVPKVPETNTPPVVVVPPSNGGNNGGSTGGSDSEESQPSYNTPGGKYTGPEIKFDVTSTDSKNPSLLGPSTGVAVINSDIVINAGENNIAKLRNIKVYGNIIINGKNGSGGSVILDNVKVYKTSEDKYGFNSGRVILNDASVNSLSLQNEVDINKLLIEDNNGATINVSNSKITEFEFSNVDKVTRSIENVKLELKDNSVIEELLVKTENLEINDSIEAIKFIQGDGVELENIKTNSNSNLKEFVKEVNTEDKIKEKITEINNLYRTSNGMTETKLYDYVNNKLRVLIENIADMEMTYGNDQKIFNLPDTYKTFDLLQRIAIAGHVNGDIPRLEGGKITDLSQLRKIIDDKMPFAIRELEISKYIGRDKQHNIDISKIEVGETVEEMFKVKDGEELKDYYTFKLLKADNDFTQVYNGKVYLMKKFALKRYAGTAYGSTDISVSCNEKIPQELKTKPTQTNLRFMYNNIVNLDKDISFVDIAKTPSGIRIVLRAEKNDGSVQMSDKDFTFKINGVDLKTSLDSSLSENGIMAYNGDYIYIYNVENSDSIKDTENILTTTFNENGEKYEYKKKFNLENRELEGLYEFKLEDSSKEAIENDKIKIKALEKAYDYTEDNKRYLLNLELSSYYNTTSMPNLNENDFWDFSGMCFNANGNGEEGEIPAVQFEYAKIINKDGKVIIQIPLTLKSEPKENEKWIMNISERSDKVIVDPISFVIDFSNVAEKTQIQVGKLPEKVKVEEALSDEYGRVKEFNTEGRNLTSVSLIKGTDNYSNVRLVVEKVEGSDDLSGIELIAKDSSGNWYNIVKTGWGPKEGFELASATTDIYMVANKSGNYKATVKLIDVSNDNKVIAQSKVVQIEADGKAPEFLEGPVVTNATNNSASLYIKTNESSKAYYMVVEHEQDHEQKEPTFEQVMNKEKYDGKVVSYGTYYYNSYNSEKRLGGLIEGTTFTVYLFLEDEFENRQEKISSVSFTTDKDETIQNFLEGYPKLKDVTSNSATISLMVDEASIAHYVILEKGAEEPTIEQIKRKQNNSGQKLVGESFEIIDDTVEKDRVIENLKEDQSYVIYLVLEDVSGNTKSESIKLEINR